MSTLKKLFTVLESIKDIDLIIFYGTLLGYVRENDFIPRDDDIDILVNRKDLTKLINMLRTLNININLFIELKENNTLGKTGVVQLRFDDFKETLDFYVYDELENNICISWDGGLLFNKDDMFPLKNVSFKDISINIPNNTEEILKEIYGTNWRTPLEKDKYKWEDINSVKKDSTYAISRWAEASLQKQI